MRKQKPVNLKDVTIEATYGYMNIHLSLLHKAIEENNIKEIDFQKEQLSKTRNVLLKLGYFERMCAK